MPKDLLLPSLWHVESLIPFVAFKETVQCAILPIYVHSMAVLEAWLT
jgi:hypothetical protein